MAKIGANHARDMFRRGLVELQAASFFQESNIAQSNYHSLYGDREPEPTPEQPAPEQGPEIERER